MAKILLDPKAHERLSEALMANDESSLREIAHDTLDRLIEWRDDVRLRAHLASMDARDAWKEVEPQVENVTAKLRSVLDATVPGGSEQARLELELGIADAKVRLEEIERRFERMGHDLARDGRDAIEKLRAKVGKVVSNR